MATTKTIRPFDEQDTRLAMGKSAREKAKSDVINSVKKLTKEGKHIEAKSLYDEQFPGV